VVGREVQNERRHLGLGASVGEVKLWVRNLSTVRYLKCGMGLMFGFPSLESVLQLKLRFDPVPCLHRIGLWFIMYLKDC